MPITKEKKDMPTAIAVNSPTNVNCPGSPLVPAVQKIPEIVLNNDTINSIISPHAVVNACKMLLVLLYFFTSVAHSVEVSKLSSIFCFSK